MSMKRARKTGSSGRSGDSEAAFPLFGTPQLETRGWEELVAARGDAAFKPYAPSVVFHQHDLIEHPKFGKGIVQLVDGAKVEVLFQDGARKLGHALQP